MALTAAHLNMRRAYSEWHSYESINKPLNLPNMMQITYSTLSR